jgi:hypothetical protein
MHYTVRYREGTEPDARTGTQVISADSDAEAERIAAKVCRAGKFNGGARRVILSVDPVR